MFWEVRNKRKGAPGSGTPGAAATVNVGTVTTGLPGSSATVINSGTTSNAVLDFAIPRGNNGNPGNAATVAVGTVTTGAAGSSTNVVNAGTSAAAVLNFTIPRGDQGIAGPSTVGTPNARTPVFGTAYQATDNTKPSFVSAMIDAAYTVTVASTLSDTVELRIGPVQTTVANGTGGTAVATFRASLTGIALVIGLGLGQRNQLSALLPAGWWWAIRRVAGTTATITSATDQSLG